MIKRRSKNGIWFALVAIIVLLGVGYSALTSTLDINGITNVTTTRWNVNLANVQVTAGSVTAPAPTINSSNSTINYQVTLANPGDFYEFTVDAKNLGSIDAMIESVSSKYNSVEITNNLPKYLNYRVSYDDDSTIVANQRLNAGQTKKIKIRVEFRSVVNPTDLPTSNQSMSFSFQIKYIQVEEGTVIDNSGMKKMIVLGDRDGVPSTSMESVLGQRFNIIASMTECFTCTAAGAMDLQNQQRIKDAVNAYGAANVIVVLGSAEDEDAALKAETLTIGDPTYAGPLTGISLQVPVYHIFDPAIRAYTDTDAWESHIGMVEMVLDTDALVNEVKFYRDNYSIAHTLS